MHYFGQKKSSFFQKGVKNGGEPTNLKKSGHSDYGTFLNTFFKGI
jgi:hypothetical protein